MLGGLARYALLRCLGGIGRKQHQVHLVGYLLLAHRGVIFSREEILRRIWSDEVIVLDRTVDVNITRLRRKIGPYGGHIVTRLGYGYGFEE